MRRGKMKSDALALVLSVLSLMIAIPAKASIAVLVEEPYGGHGMNPAGHSAIYFDHICAASPTTLRPCREDELGVVISRYDGIANYDWLAMPLVPYLYAVDSADDVPVTMDKETQVRLRDAYRRKHLMDIAPDREDGSAPEGNWYELVGSAYDRTSYGFEVKTTADQDAGLIAMFNDRKNVEKYNGAFRNCADFARVTINHFYPHAIRRNIIADFGITTPKQVAHAMTRYGDKHPETEFAVFVVPQVEGSLPRSRKVKGVTECLVTCKRYLLPITVVQPVATAAMLVAYISKGRFSMPKDAPVLSMKPGETAAGDGGPVALPAAVKTTEGEGTRTLLTPEH
jgi:hypothetical protein